MKISSSKIPSKKRSCPCKTVSDFSFDLYESVKTIDTLDWNKVVKFGSEFMQLSYLSVLEKERPENLNFHYAIIYKAQQPIALVCFEVVDFYTSNIGGVLNLENEESDCLVKAYIKKYFTNHLLRTVDKENIRILVCGNIFISGEHGFIYDPEINKKEVFDAFTDVIEGINNVEKARAGKIAVVLLKDFYLSENNSEELKEFKFHDFITEPNMILDIHWETFDVYLNAMSKKYRNRAKNVIKTGTEIQRKDFSEKDIVIHIERIQQLYKNVHSKAKFNMAVLPTTYFAELKKAMNDTFSFVGYYYKDELIGFRTSFILENSVEAHFIGLNYEVNKELKLYQNILYDYVREAIDTRSKRLFLGRTASEIKSTVGAEAHPLKCYIRHENSLSNHFIKPIINSLEPEIWIPRNPFKEES